MFLKELDSDPEMWTQELNTPKYSELWSWIFRDHPESEQTMDKWVKSLANQDGY